MLAFSRAVLGICPWSSSACVVATASTTTSPSLRACQHRNWAGFPAAFQPIQSFEGLREPVSSMCLSPCQSKLLGQAWLSTCLRHSHLCIGSVHHHRQCRHGLYFKKTWWLPLLDTWSRQHFVLKRSQTVYPLPFSPSSQFNVLQVSLIELTPGSLH